MDRVLGHNGSAREVFVCPVESGRSTGNFFSSHELQNRETWDSASKLEKK